MENTSLNPVITIEQFSGSGQNGILYCEGLYPEIDNGKSSMGEGFYTQSRFNTSTTGMSNIATIKAILPLSTVNNPDALYNLYYNGFNLFISS